MRAEVIGIGTEILLGQICNDNAQWISERLAEIGVDVLHHQVVGDNEGRISEAFRLALSRADAVISTGGLGPTQDDITREALARALGVQLERREDIGRFLKERFERLHREMPGSNLRQSDVPRGARYILPETGTAPGLIFETVKGQLVFAVPGVPSEMRQMLESTVLPELAKRAGPTTLVSRTVKATGIAEARVGELLDDLFRASENPTIAFLSSGGEVRVRVSAKASDRPTAEALVQPVVEEVARRLGDHVFTSEDLDLEQVVGRLLKAHQLTVACAESLTGGGLGLRLSRAPGASGYFLGSAVTYAPEAKAGVLGVPREVLDGAGAVSEECAIAMARGARELFDADIALALTGVAGPEPHDDKPVGTVCVGFATGAGVERSRCFRAPGDRAQVRRWAEQAALDVLRRHLEGLPEPMELGAVPSG